MILRPFVFFSLQIYFKEQQQIGVAISVDPDAKPGTFYKWRFMGSASEVPVATDWPFKATTNTSVPEPPSAEWQSPGLGGVYTGLPDVASFESYRFGNPVPN